MCNRVVAERATQSYLKQEDMFREINELVEYFDHAHVSFSKGARQLKADTDISMYRKKDAIMNTEWHYEDGKRRIRERA